MYKFLKKQHNKLKYLYYVFTINQGYLFLNYKKIRNYFKRNKETFQIIKNYVLKTKKENVRKIVFVIDGDIHKVGGVEIRLQKMLKYLEFHNFAPFIIAKENNFQSLKKYSYINFSFKNYLSLKFFTKIIKKIAPEYVEIQLKYKSPKILAYISEKPINCLKKITKIGVFFHSIQPFLLEEQIKSFDNIFSVYTDWLKKFKNLQNKICKIPNFITLQKNSWKYSGQTKILYISRLSYDKKQCLYNLLSLCKGYNYSIDIAGSGGEKDFIKNIKDFALTNNININFIGEISTIEYLNKNLNNILFVAGVGQVIFEAASFNIPAFVTTHRKNAAFSQFVTKDNVQIITTYNCVIKTLNLFGCGLNDFFADIPNNLEKYSVKDYFEKNYSTDKVMRVYIDILQRK